MAPKILFLALLAVFISFVSAYGKYNGLYCDISDDLIEAKKSGYAVATDGTAPVLRALTDNFVDSHYEYVNSHGVYILYWTTSPTGTPALAGYHHPLLQNDEGTLHYGARVTLTISGLTTTTCRASAGPQHGYAAALCDDTVLVLHGSRVIPYTVAGAGASTDIRVYGRFTVIPTSASSTTVLYYNAEAEEDADIINEATITDLVSLDTIDAMPSGHALRYQTTGAQPGERTLSMLKATKVSGSKTKATLTTATVVENVAGVVAADPVFGQHSTMEFARSPASHRYEATVLVHGAADAKTVVVPRLGTSGSDYLHYFWVSESRVVLVIVEYNTDVQGSLPIYAPSLVNQNKQLTDNSTFHFLFFSDSSSDGFEFERIKSLKASAVIPRATLVGHTTAADGFRSAGGRQALTKGDKAISIENVAEFVCQLGVGQPTYAGADTNDSRFYLVRMEYYDTIFGPESNGVMIGIICAVVAVLVVAFWILLCVLGQAIKPLHIVAPWAWCTCKKKETVDHTDTEVPIMPAEMV